MTDTLDFANVPQVEKVVEINGALVGVTATQEFVALARLVVPVAPRQERQSAAYAGKKRGRKPGNQQKTVATNSGASHSSQSEVAVQ